MAPEKGRICPHRVPNSYLCRDPPQSHRHASYVLEYLLDPEVGVMYPQSGLTDVIGVEVFHLEVVYTVEKSFAFACPTLLIRRWISNTVTSLSRPVRSFRISH